MMTYCGHTSHADGSYNCAAPGAPQDAQVADLLEACYERNIHSRGDMEYAFQPSALDVERLARALVATGPGIYAWPEGGSPRVGTPYKVNAVYEAGRLAAEYARLSRLPTEEER